METTPLTTKGSMRPKGVDETPFSQFDNGGSTGHLQCDRNQVGSKKDAGAGDNMETIKQVQVEDREATKEQGAAARRLRQAAVPAF